MTAQFIKMGGGSLKDVTLSTSSAWRERDKAVSDGGDKILKEFITNVPELIVLHWDGKIIHYEDGETDERLCVKVRNYVKTFYMISTRKLLKGLVAQQTFTQLASI